MRSREFERKRTVPSAPLLGRVGFACLLCALLGATAAPGLPLVVECELQLRAPEGHPYGYAPRGDRCEGVFARQISGAPLLVVSFTKVFADYDLSNPKPLRLAWPTTGARADAADSDEVWIRANALPRRFYYRMDTVQPAERGVYSWPIDVLAALKVDRSKLGILAWRTISIEGAERRVHLPLVSSQGDREERPDSSRLDLLVIPGQELEEIYVTVEERREGSEPRMLQRSDPLEYGYYPPYRPVAIRLEGIGASGLYRVDLGAKLPSGAAVTLEFWFETGS